MENKRFILEDYYDEGTAIRDMTKPSENGQNIVIVLPVYIWALEPLINLLNELHEAVQSE